MMTIDRHDSAGSARPDGPPPELGIYAYAWDVAERGIAPFVEEIRALGLNTVTLACAYHGARLLRPHGVTGRLAFPPDGAIYFRHRPERYGRLAPEAAPQGDGGDVLAGLCASDIGVTAWMVLNHDARLGRAVPEATIETAHGDRVLDSLCPSNPLVRDYAVALCGDVAHGYGIDAMVLEATGFKPLQVGAVRFGADLAVNEWLLGAMGLCFCPSCIERAGGEIDADALRIRVRTRIDAFLAAGVAPGEATAARWWAADMATDGDLWRFLEVRRRTVTSLVRDIRAALPGACRLRVIAAQHPDAAAGWADGMDIPALAEACDGVEVTLYGADARTRAANAWDARRRAGATARLGAVLRPAHPDHASAGEVAATVRDARAAGFRDIAFYNYGRMPRRSLDWIAAALMTS